MSLDPDYLLIPEYAYPALWKSLQWASDQESDAPDVIDDSKHPVTFVKVKDGNGYKIEPRTEILNRADRRGAIGKPKHKEVLKSITDNDNRTNL